MTILENAYAKINLYLDVVGRREDGFHDIKSLMHTITLCDTIRLITSYSDNGRISLNSNIATLENDENNLIYKSALKYTQKFGINDNIDVELTKRIPIGAGLGGGSADAAATLRAMNKIYGLASDDQMLEMAAEIGSDVPFCLVGGCAVCTGRGERVRPVSYDFPQKNVVIAIGESRVSTPRAYAMLDEKFGNFADHNKETGFDDSSIAIGYNIFESVIDISEIDEIKRIMKENNAESALMSGSGPSVFGIYSSEVVAQKTVMELEKRGFWAINCKLI